MKEPIFKFSILSSFPNLIHGMSTKNDGNMKFLAPNSEKGEVIQSREKFCQFLGINLDEVVAPEAIHSTDIKEVGLSDLGKGARSFESTVKGVDGLITKEQGVNLLITAADCAPVFVYDPINQIIGLFHAGWRGISAGIGWKIIEKFKALGSDSSNLVIGVGPSICQKHFVLREDVLNHFVSKYPKAVLLRNRDGYVDLRRCLKQDFLAGGVSAGNMEIATNCTFCDNYYFSSYRANGEKTIYQAAVLGIKK